MTEEKRFKKQKIKSGISPACGLILMLAFLITFGGKNARAATLNVPGSYSTIQSAVDAAASGDTISVGGGTYSEKVMITKSGITIISNPARAATVDGTGKVPQYEGIFTVDGANNVKISGFKVISSDYAGIGVNGRGTSSGIIIENNYVSTTKSSAIFAGNASNVTIDGNELTNAHEWPGGTENEVLSLITVNGFDIKNNWIHDNKDTESIDVKWGSKNGRVHHNDIKSVRSAGIYFDAWSEIQENNLVYDNFVHDGGNDSRGIAIAVENGGGIRNMKVYNNIVYNNSANGIVVDFYTACDHDPCPPGPLENIYITNNTVVKNNCGVNWEGGIVNKSAQSTTSGIYFRNNIVSQNCGSQFWLATANTTIENNLIDGANSISCVNCVSGSPQFQSSGSDFHLTGSSPAIDKGTSTGAPGDDYDGKSRPSGAGYDIGAYEYGGAAASPSPSPSVPPGPSTPTPTPDPSTPTPTPDPSTPTPDPSSSPSPSPSPSTPPPCTDTCSTYNFVCGTHTICGIQVNCDAPGCSSPQVCYPSTGQCVLPPPNCGNSLKESGEACDFGNNLGCTGSTPRCNYTCSACVIAQGASASALPAYNSTPTDINVGNPSKSSSVKDLIISITNWLLRMIAGLTILFLIIGGIYYLTSAGDQQRMETAKRIITYAILGLVIVLISYSVITTVNKIILG